MYVSMFLTLQETEKFLKNSTNTEIKMPSLGKEKKC